MNQPCLEFRHLVKFRNSVRLSKTVRLIPRVGIIHRAHPFRRFLELIDDHGRDNQLEPSGFDLHEKLPALRIDPWIEDACGTRGAGPGTSE